MYAFFYDNSDANRDYHRLCPHIKFHKVKDNPTFKHGDEQALLTMLAEEPKSVKDVALMYSKHVPHSFFDPTSGLTLENGIDFFQHVMHAARLEHVSAFIFDWDRTLQQFECMSKRSFEFWCQEHSALSLTQRYQLSKAMAVFHSGGTERFHKLRHMFAEIQRHGKLVNIITANPAVITPGRAVFLQIIEQWGLVYFRLNYSTNKYMHMARDPMLNTICGP